MTDALTILRRGHPALPNGILIPEVMIRAAQLEGVTLPVAAAILEGESAGGKNIWGADGGLDVKANGTYKPRTEVTKTAYLAYRTEMRAKRIIRQGVGPCQCTSAQYQDTADALGGCWDILANCRSGFRGMGALIKAHGVRGGSRRYNGSGPNAEAYADRFVQKHDRWVALGLPLDPGAVTVAVPPAAPAAAPAAAPVVALGTELVMNPMPLTGSGARRFFLDPPGASVIERAFISLVVDGPDGAAASCRVYPQRPGGGTAPMRELKAAVLTDGSHTTSRDWMELPAGTDQAQLQFAVAAGATAYIVPAFRAQK